MISKLIWCLFGLVAVSQGAWVRVWEDNFDWNGGVDLNKWEFDVGGSGWGRSNFFFRLYSVETSLHVLQAILRRNSILRIVWRMPVVNYFPVVQTAV